ncbi:MAG: hypothetical protein IK015_02655 [Treponema sp.]|nr:hypothetical protein [Treponema sp.]
MKTNMKKSFFAAVVAGAAFFVSCSDGGSSFVPLNVNNHSVLSYLDTKNAQSFCHVEKQTASANLAAKSLGDGEDEGLFKITTQNIFEKVKFYDENGQEDTSVLPPTFIQSLNDEWFYVERMIYSAEIFYYANKTNYWCFIRKSDGKVFDISDILKPKQIVLRASRAASDPNIPYWFSDNNGNFYCAADCISSNSFGILRVNPINKEDSKFIKLGEYAPTNGMLSFFSDIKGNLYSLLQLPKDISNSAAGSYRVHKILKGNGEEYIVPDGYDNFWLGNDGQIYCCFNDNGSYVVDKIIIGEDWSVTPTHVGSVGDGSHSGPGTLSEMIRFKNKNLVIFPGVWKYNESTKTGKSLELPIPCAMASLFGISRDHCVLATENYYYCLVYNGHNPQQTEGPIVTKYGLIRMNPDNDEGSAPSCVYILPFEYEEIYDFYVISESEGAVFSAKRSDGVCIVGKVGINGGDVKIIEEGAKVTKLVKITN